MPLNHGHNDTSGVYDSAALFIRHDASKQEFLFFGDVEPDSISANPRTINVWRAAAPKIPAILSTIFIECSWLADRPDNLLYGHLSPKHLVDELAALAAEVVTAQKIDSKEPRQPARPLRKRYRANPTSSKGLRGALAGLKVFIIHCKDGNTVADRPINHIITEQVRILVETKGLGAEILLVDQGMHIGREQICTFLLRLTDVNLHRNLSLRFRPFDLFWCCIVFLVLPPPCSFSYCLDALATIVSIVLIQSTIKDGLYFHP